MAIARDLVGQVERLLRPLKVRVANSIARAVVQLVDDSTKLQILQLGVLAGEDVDDAERFQEYGFSSNPLPGAEAVVVFPNGDRAHALVVAVDDRRYRPAAGAPGEVVVYNHAGASIRLKADGTVEIGTDGGVFEPLVKRSEFLKHTHATAALGTPSPPIAHVTGGSALAFPGTTKLRGE